MNDVSTVSLKLSDHIAVLTLTRPYSLNIAGKHELLDTLRQLSRQEDLRALVITSGHPEAFLVDVAELAPMNSTEAKAFSEAGHQIASALADLPFPTIAAIDGQALGGGCELVMSCDLAYASDRSHLGQIEVLGGIIPGFGGTWRLAHRVGLQRACELIFSAAVIDAARAKELGLVLDVFPAEKLLSHCHEVVDKIAKNSKLAIAQAKKVLLAGASLPLSEALTVEQVAFTSLFGTDEQRGRMSTYVKQRDTQKQ
jgi:enoyl-CoA hydratase